MTNEETEELVELVFGGFPTLTVRPASVMAYHLALKHFTLRECVDALEILLQSENRFPPSATDIFHRIKQSERALQSRDCAKKQLAHRVEMEKLTDKNDKEIVQIEMAEARKKYPHLYNQ